MSLVFFARSLFILFFSFSSLLFAAQFDNPYQGNIIAEKQSESELKELALKQVLVKVSGNVKIADLVGTDLLNQTNSLLSQYGYHVFQNDRYFMAVFDSRKINEALQSMQQPIWGDTRPTTLVWLIEDSGSDRQLLSDNMVNFSTDSELSSVLQEEQRSRGIALQFPIMDLEDNLALSLSDISGRFYGPIATASQRYGANHFVIANLKQTNADIWSLAWELVKYNSLSKQTEVLFSKNAKGSKTILLSAMVGDTADYYASQYAILENQTENFSQTIYVSGINSLVQLTELNKVLSSLLAIASFEIAEADGSQVTVNIKINGGLASFKNGLFAQPNLQADLSQSDEFHFDWR
ncbi:DUF2066 domain-containing protein [Psychromonas antarctica]|uniref:DUF2066 domain-containing protein n=1 Tax=Psychromonas antarctica TaxID=67573 RepID=UPI001EE86452|nr:DUF2066 domain-containing protein [Psychromonas antarctica]MCG6199934.1 DUF2066 domain-containing protein [Psychromonas antarctica]